MPRRPGPRVARLPESMPLKELTGYVARLHYDWQENVRNDVFNTGAAGIEAARRNYERAKAVLDTRIAAGEKMSVHVGLGDLNRVRSYEAACKRALRDLHNAFSTGYRTAVGKLELRLVDAKVGRPVGAEQVADMLRPMVDALRDAADMLRHNLAALGTAHPTSIHAETPIPEDVEIVRGYGAPDPDDPFDPANAAPPEMLDDGYEGEPT